MEKPENKALNLGKNKGAITPLENGKYRYSKMIITDSLPCCLQEKRLCQRCFSFARLYNL